MSTGWIKLHRKFLEWEWYDDINTKILFLHCLLKANHKDKKWRGNLIKRGSFITSLSHLSNETGLSVQNIRTSFDKLESTGEINKISTSVNTCVTITNYDDYQESNKVSTNGQQATNKRLTTTKNEKNVKNEKNKIPTLSEVKDYFKENGYDPKVAEKAFNIYNASIEDHPKRKYWRDSRDNLIKNWKLKMQSVWFKEENEMSRQQVFDGGTWNT